MTLLESMPESSEIILYGAGADAKEIAHYFKGDARFLGFCDKREEKQKNGFLGCRVIDPQELLEKKNASICVCTRKYNQEVIQFLLENGVEKERIYNLKDCMIAYDSEQYFNEDFISFEPDEIFIDAGCWNLGSSKKLEKYCPALYKIYAFEPDPKNYQVCLERKAMLKTTQIELMPYATWSEKTKLFFDARQNAGSKVAIDGQVCVEAVPIDEVVDTRERITFIKMDVEGAELESLKGAKKTIQRDKPKLAICIYHKMEDMTEIPLYIKSLVPEYKFYVRHYCTSTVETVLYAVL